MWAAASGHSTIGIPKKVGKEFAEADPGGKLPEKKKSKGETLYDHPRSRRASST
jgi:hypothetical protein